ncbi:MAG: Glycine--tRNA ligase beta subunit [Alphaproteobacteria bacterium MarineAlpha10_Bin3]|nr:MAG: Glycine--tRNA ligase beta subunit [Alphaproteobacteria bacterium MarineAlpha10_Bin3]PPR70769.1 MAG: Glycine--tRNA ligase beta subunit [Alphaproteobacteria bacterium MarineAlpha4_Bin1]
MPELLLELLSEEIPARMQRRAAQDLQRLVIDGLSKARLDFASAQAYVTPRRLILVIDGLPVRQPDLREERKGPRVGAPDKAIAGFLRGAGLDSLDQCVKRDTGKGEAWFAVIERKGAAAQAVFPELLNDVFAKFPWPKSMRWGNETQRWVRPVQGILCVFDGDVVENVAFNNDPSSSMTVGHRFLSPGPITVSSFADYRAKLRQASVMIDPAERREIIAAGLATLADAEGLRVKDDPGLLDEVTGLVEWPVPLLGDIDPAFMDLPAEALTSSMRAHQKYFTLLNPDGSLVPRFGFVANIEAAEGGKAIIAGNERVLRARLADAKFFWDQDRKTPLADRAPALEAIVFHAKLGSVAAKVGRIAALAGDLAGTDGDAASRAALLCKADLVTGMVAEFPDLQGVMGRYYALADGESSAVADAIADHYAPQGPNDRCPDAPVSVAVALADKIDTLAGFWLIDQKPTGSKDPYALRRAALGVIRLILENGLRIRLIPVFEAAMQRHRNDTPDLPGNGGEAIDLLNFFADRLKVHLRDQGVRHDLIAAVFALSGEDDLVRLRARVDALTRFLASDDGVNLLAAYKRAVNIVAIEEKKDGARYDGAVETELLREPEERKFYEYLSQATDGAQEALALEGFEAAMAAMAGLRAPVDEFFNQVTVNADDADLRVNRLRLLSQFRTTLHRIADFSQIEG